MKNYRALTLLLLPFLLNNAWSLSYAEHIKTLCYFLGEKNASSTTANKTLHDFKVDTIDGNTQSLNDFKGHVVLVVNIARKCGLKAQITALEAAYKKYQHQGFVVLGFPSNQFANQEPGNNNEINDFYRLKQGVTFPLYAKVDVNGDNAHPLFSYLQEQAPGLLGSKFIKWNFTKFLINQQGKVVKRYGPSEDPASAINDIETLLSK